jgi:hypothetical protein
MTAIIAQRRSEHVDATTYGDEDCLDVSFALGALALVEPARLLSQPVLYAACSAHPELFARRPTTPKMPDPAWISYSRASPRPP